MEIINEKYSMLQKLVSSNEEVNIHKLDELIDNDELVSIISSNNDEMKKIINEDLLDEEIDIDKIKKLLFINFNLYRLAKYREINVPDFNFNLATASFVNYPYDQYINYNSQNYLTKK